MGYSRQHIAAFDPAYLSELQGQILACPYLSVNNLNRDFVATRGFSVVFREAGRAQVERRFPYFRRYLSTVLQQDCNAFYLNPLLLTTGSRVDPHIDRSLRSYCKTIEPPQVVSVLYVQVPPALVGGELVLSTRGRTVGRIIPKTNTLVYFQGDLTHAVSAVHSPGLRLSLVCEQYQLEAEQLAQIPDYAVESRSMT